MIYHSLLCLQVTFAEAASTANAAADDGEHSSINFWPADSLKDVFLGNMRP